MSETALARNEGRFTAALRRRPAKVLSRLRALLAGDPEPLQLLAWWEQGAVGRAAVRRSGMPAQTYDRVRRRIVQLAWSPPAALVAAPHVEATATPEVTAMATPAQAPAAVTAPTVTAVQRVRTRAGRAARHGRSRRGMLRSA